MVQPGDLLLVRRPRIGSKMIAWGQSLRFPKEYSYWSHAAIVVSPIEIVEALGRGVALSPITKYDEHPHKFVSIPADDETRARVVRFAMHCVGTRYAFSEILTLGLYLASGTHWRVTRNNQLVCSALAAEALSRTDAIFPEEPLWCTPAHLAQYYDVKKP